MKRIIFATLLAFTTSAHANPQKELGIGLFLATHTYAQMRVASENCNLGPDEWVSMRTRILTTFMANPSIDLMKVERDMDDYYLAEKGRMGRDCSDAHKQLYQRGVNHADYEIGRLRELVEAALPSTRETGSDGKGQAAKPDELLATWHEQNGICRGGPPRRSGDEESLRR